LISRIHHFSGSSNRFRHFDVGQCFQTRYVDAPYLRVPAPARPAPGAFDKTFGLELREAQLRAPIRAAGERGDQRNSREDSLAALVGAIGERAEQSLAKQLGASAASAKPFSADNGDESMTHARAPMAR
jgi:hypothetical protein